MREIKEKEKEEAAKAKAKEKEEAQMKVDGEQPKADAMQVDEPKPEVSKKDGMWPLPSSSLALLDSS